MEEGHLQQVVQEQLEFYQETRTSDTKNDGGGSSRCSSMAENLHKCVLCAGFESQYCKNKQKQPIHTIYQNELDPGFSGKIKNCKMLQKGKRNYKI